MKIKVNMTGIIISMIIIIFIAFAEPGDIWLEHMELFYFGKLMGLFFMFLILTLSFKMEIGDSSENKS